MKNSILAMSFFILSFLFSSCAGTADGLSVDTQIQIGQLLDIKQPKQNNKCRKIPVYKEPPVAYCNKKMSKDECLIYMSSVSMQVRYQMRKQIKVCEAINRRYQK
jgi:FlaA1/EpsC-like NDP-sugar epimerase